MATTQLGITVPAASDAFDPQGDMVDLANSMRSRVIVPVANKAGRDALVAAIDWTPSASEPLRVGRGDTGVVEVSAGAGFYAVTERSLAVLKSGTPADKTLAAASTVDLIAAGDSGGIPSVTLDPGGRVKLDVGFCYIAAATGVAAAGNLQLLIDGAVTGAVLQVHTSTGSNANVQKTVYATLEGWLSPGVAHTVNARITHTGGGGITIQHLSYAVRG